MRNPWIPWFISSKYEYKAIGRIKEQKFKAWTNDSRGGGVPAILEGEIISIDKTNSRIKARIRIQTLYNLYKLKPIYTLIFIVVGLSSWLTMVFGLFLGSFGLFLAAFPVFFCVAVVFLIGIKGAIGEREKKDLKRYLENLFRDYKLPKQVPIPSK